MTDVNQKFWSLVDTSGGPDACWPWIGPVNDKGYGDFFLGRGEDGARKNGQILAHRYAFFLAHGRWPNSQALHKCDNRPCCNQGHLFEGDHLTNMQDRLLKNRYRYKTTDEQVEMIRILFSAGGMSLREIARVAGVGRDTARLIAKGVSS